MESSGGVRLCLLIARGSHIPPLGICRFDLSHHAYILKSYGMQKELDIKFLEMQATLASGLGPDANGQSVLDAFKKTVYPDIKSDLETMLENYKRVFDQGGDQMLTIRVKKNESILLQGKK